MGRGGRDRARGGGKGNAVQKMQPKGTCYVGEHGRPLLVHRGHPEGHGRVAAGGWQGGGVPAALGALGTREDAARAAPGRRLLMPLLLAAAAAAAGEPGGAVLEDEQPDQVDGQPQGAHDEHQLGVIDALGPGQAQHGLHEDGEAERGKEDGVAERAHHLGAGVAVGGAQAPARAPGDVAGAQPHAQRDQVRQHVEGVGQQRDGVAQVARHQLGHEEGDGEHEHEQQPARLARVAAHPRPADRPAATGGARRPGLCRGLVPASRAALPAGARASYKAEAEAERPRSPHVQSLKEGPGGRI